MIYQCCDEQRRLAVTNQAGLNGIDYLEVLDAEAPGVSPRQKTLLVRFLKTAPAVPGVLSAANFEITGGERITDIDIVWAMRADAPDATKASADEIAYFAALAQPDEVIVLRTTSSGDFSSYTLHLVAAAGSLKPPQGIDPLLSHVGFSFKVECPTDFDCAPVVAEPPAAEAPPQISYLAKDYRSFRRLMLDRMAQTLPEWRERNVSDLGVALVEVLAYVGDRLSYAQDAVATEAYLGTARRRVSLRRHAKLVDYAVRDGANARAFVQVQTDQVSLWVRRSETSFATRAAGHAPIVARGTRASAQLLAAEPLIFEPLADTQVFGPHGEMFFYDWGNAECQLAAGATRATLDGDFPNLKPGDVLIFEEIVSPRTGARADADPRRRCAVRLVQRETDTDVLNTRPVTEIRWHEADALPFPIVLSARVGDGLNERLVGPISRVLGNIVLCDHGMQTSADLGTVPEPHLHLVASGESCDDRAPRAVPPRYSPILPEAPLTQAAPLPAASVAASAMLVPDVAAARPSITLMADDGEAWGAEPHLLANDPSDPAFVVEIETNGQAHLRFGDDRHGKRPASRTAFTAFYRVGNGPQGNAGADAIAHVITTQAGIIAVRNPLPAAGGRAPESMAEIRLAAPQAFRTQQRAVTPEDYAAIALRYPSVQRAAATFRWNGHGHTVFITVDRFGERPVTADFEAGLIGFIDPFRMAGYDLEIDEPRYVALEIELKLCCRQGYFQSEVKRAALDVLGSVRLPDGRLGLFHPDNLSFGEPVYLSRVIAAVQALEGVESVTPLVFRRMGQPDPVPLEAGMLPIGRLEIARLANNRNFPERGRLTITMGGGK